MLVAFALILLVPVVVWIGSNGRSRNAQNVTTLITWAIAAWLEPRLLPDPLDDAAEWRFFWLWLPFTTTAVATLLATLLGGTRVGIALVAGWLGALLGVYLMNGSPVPADEFWECVVDVSLPSVFASSFAVFASGIPPRRAPR